MRHISEIAARQDKIRLLLLRGFNMNQKKKGEREIIFSSILSCKFILVDAASCLYVYTRLLTIYTPRVFLSSQTI